MAKKLQKEYGRLPLELLVAGGETEFHTDARLGWVYGLKFVIISIPARSKDSRRVTFMFALGLFTRVGAKTRRYILLQLWIETL